MKAHEIFRDAPPQLTQEILTYFRDEQREIYKAAITTLAQQRKLRPIFVLKKPLPEQYAWLMKILQNKLGDGLGEHLLQVYLLKKHPKMLTMFLDELGVEHNGEGEVDKDLPEEFETEKIKAGVEKILGEFPGPLVGIYLHLFQRQSDKGWSEISAILEQDERLRIKA